MQSDHVLEFREQGLYLFSLPLRVSELWRVGQLAGTLPGQLIHVDSKILIASTCAWCFLRARPATFGAANVSVSTIANIQANVVELFSRRTAIAVAFWLISKTLRSVEGAVLALSALSRPHVRNDFPLCQPLQKLPIPVGRVGRDRFWLSSLPLRETGEHVLRGYGLLAQSRRRCLYSHNYTTGIVHQVVVVVTEASRGTTFGGVSGIRIGGRYQVLLMHRFFHRVLLFQFHQILTHAVMDLCRF